MAVNVPDLGFHAVSTERVTADTSEFMAWFYSGDVREHDVRRAIRERNCEVVHSEYDEGGNLCILYFNRVGR